MARITKGKATLMRVRVTTNDRLEDLAQRSGINKIDLTERILKDFLDSVGDEAKVDFYIKKL